MQYEALENVQNQIDESPKLHRTKNESALHM